MSEIIFKTTITVVYGIISIFFIYQLWIAQIDPLSMLKNIVKKTEQLRQVKIKALEERAVTIFGVHESDKIYQNHVAVGTVLRKDTESDGQISFEVLVDTANLKIDEPFEYGRKNLKILSMQAHAASYIDPQGQNYKNALINVKCAVQ